MANEALSALAGVVVGGALSYLTALRVADMSAGHARRAAEAEYRRSMQVARLDRMRAHYAVLLRAMRALEAQAMAAESEGLVAFDQGTIDEEAYEAMRAVRDVEPAMLLEDDGPDMLDAFREMNEAHNDYRLALHEAKQGRRKGFSEKQQRLKTAVGAIIMKARDNVQTAAKS